MIPLLLLAACGRHREVRWEGPPVSAAVDGAAAFGDGSRVAVVHDVEGQSVLGDGRVQRFHRTYSYVLMGMAVDGGVRLSRESFEVVRDEREPADTHGDAQAFIDDLPEFVTAFVVGPDGVIAVEGMAGLRTEAARRSQSVEGDEPAIVFGGLLQNDAVTSICGQRWDQWVRAWSLQPLIVGQPVRLDAVVGLGHHAAGLPAWLEGEVTLDACEVDGRATSCTRIVAEPRWDAELLATSAVEPQFVTDGWQTSLSAWLDPVDGRPRRIALDRIVPGDGEWHRTWTFTYAQ